MYPRFSATFAAEVLLTLAVVALFSVLAVAVAGLLEVVLDEAGLLAVAFETAGLLV